MPKKTKSRKEIEKEKDRPYSGRPRNADEKKAAKASGSIAGWFNLPRGRPPAASAPAASAQAASAPAASAPSDEAGKRLASKEHTASGSKVKKPRGGYVDWTSPQNAPILQAHIDVKRSGDSEEPPFLVGPVPPDATVRTWIKKLDQCKEKNGPLMTVEEYIRTRLDIATQKPLLDLETRERLQKVIVARDERNNGMSRKEAVSLIAELGECNAKKADNHFGWLVRTGKLKELKRGGRITKAQKTTTKRSQITMEQQLRWHTAVDHVLKEMQRLNLPSDEYEKVQAHFVGNVDETCMLGNDGTIKIIASRSRSKTEKNTDDFRKSITIVRSGVAAGTSGPWIFLGNN
jgi:hypothetical protein